MAFDREGALRRAEKQLRQGNLDGAIAEYRAIIEDQPSDWNTANALGDLYFRARQTDKAVGEYNRIAEHLAGEGFLPKAAAVYKKILKIQPDEESAMWQLGSIAARQGLLAEARANFLALVDRRNARGDDRGAAEAQVRLGDLDGADIETRLAGARARAQLGDTRTAVERLKGFAADLHEKGKGVDALRLLAEAATLDPGDIELQRLLIQTYEARGDMAGARLLTSESAGANPQLLWALAEAELRGGHIFEGMELLHKLLEDDPTRRDTLVLLGCTLSASDPIAAYACVDLAATLASGADDWPSAAGAFVEFTSRVPNHVPALMRLVEICVDGGLDEMMHAAQVQLADAYLAAGAGAEARVIAEDLVAREPWEQANIDRFRRALALLGETDIDGVIADRLSGESPFTSTGAMWPAETDEKVRAAQPIAVVAATTLNAPLTADVPEIDLNEVLRDLRRNLEALAEAESPASVQPIERVLQSVHEEAIQGTTPESAERQFKLAGTFMEMGMQEEAQTAFEVAARSLSHRFVAGAALARAFLDAGNPARAIEWFERAAEAPAPSSEAQHALLYDLASVLEANGESARALAVLIELRAEAGEYRDLPLRLEQLKVQMRG